MSSAYGPINHELKILPTSLPQADFFLVNGIAMPEENERIKIAGHA